MEQAQPHAPVVRYIFDLCVSGKGPSQIAEQEIRICYRDIGLVDELPQAMTETSAGEAT